MRIRISFFQNIVLSLFFFLTIDLFAQGTVQIDSFHSESLQEFRHFSIYLPEGYDEDFLQTYPAVFFLHGFGADHLEYDEIYSVLDDLISSGEIMEMIVVKPDGSCSLYDGSFFTNSILNGNFEDYIVYDLVEYVDKNYRTKPFKEYRAVSGHSMGGYGAMKLGMKHSDVFTSVATHSGPIVFEDLTDSFLKQLVLLENLGGQFDPDNGILTRMMFAMAAAFSPNLENSPYYVDLPLGSEGDIIDSTMQKWLEHDPYTMIDEHISALNDLQIYFDCGIFDELFLYAHAVDFSDRLSELGIEHEFLSYLGSHRGQIYSRLEYSLAFHSNHFFDAPRCSLGDVDRNGVIDVLDALRMIGIFLRADESPSEYELWASDINYDGKVNVLDVVLIVNMILEG